MVFTQKYSFAALACLSLATIPVVRSAQHNVTVGGPGVLKFDPEFVNAAVGDTVIFTFKQKNHTVTQSTLTSPCSPLPDGIDSGFVPVADTVTSNFQTAILTVEKTDALWFYCRQGNHCQQGMVFAVNPGDKMEVFKNAATGKNSTSTSTSTTSAGTATPTTPSTPTATSGTDHKVVVGGLGGKLTYEPANITAKIGDTVTFEFRQKNHTVTQSTFDQPCSPFAGGFESGFQPVGETAVTFPTYTVKINDTKPIWAYCRQGNHCTQGMVFSINSVETGPNTFEAFKAKAKGGSNTGNTSNTGGSNGNGAVASGLNGAGVVVALAAMFVGLLVC